MTADVTAADLPDGRVSASRVEGPDLHQHVGRHILIEGVWARLLWADPEDNGLLLRIRTAERGREYLVRENSYDVAGEHAPIMDDDDTTDRWDNEPQGSVVLRYGYGEDS